MNVIGIGRVLLGLMLGLPMVAWAAPESPQSGPPHLHIAPGDGAGASQGQSFGQ